MVEINDDIKCGSGTCRYCNEHVTNVSYHESNHCRKNPQLAEMWKEHDADLAMKILGKPAQPNKMYEFNFNKHLLEVLVEFDFDNVCNVMLLLDRKWAIDGKLQIPDKKRIMREAIELMNHAYTYALKQPTKFGRVASGGLRAEVDIPNDCVELTFEMESYCSQN